MDTLIAIVIIAVAVWYVFAKVKTFGGKKGNGSCGCGGSCGFTPGSCQNGMNCSGSEKKRQSNR